MTTADQPSAPSVEEAVARLQQIIQQQQEQIAALAMRQDTLAPEILALQRRGVEAALDAPPKSYPEGAIPGDSRAKSTRDREQAIAKMQRLAINRGGFWFPDPTMPSRYGHRAPNLPYHKGCDHYGEAEFADSCQRTCWTPDNETRFLHALRLKDLATGPLQPATPPDPKNNRDAMLELVGLLKGQSTQADAYGRYPTLAESAEVSPGTTRKVAKAS